MKRPSITHVYIVGAGFSHYAGLPLQSEFTKALLDPDTLPVTERLVDHLSKFVSRAFDHSKTAKYPRWPHLEDIFTSIDLAANSGHHLGPDDSPSALRMTRRVLLARMMLMLNEHYSHANRTGPDWKSLDQFVERVPLSQSAFISLNWDTVVERKLAEVHAVRYFDYRCGALPAAFRGGTSVSTRTFPKKERRIPIVKIHGSVNWLYCDNCRRLFWFSPKRAKEVAEQLLKPDEAELLKLDRSQYGKWNCRACQKVPLATRIATFSYLKALDFPMFEQSWLAAERLLRRAEKWVFIGYSLPGADYEFKHLLKRIQLARTPKPKFVVITGGPNTSNTTETFNTYQRFFGRSIKRGGNFFAKGLTPRSITAAVT